VARSVLWPLGGEQTREAQCNGRNGHWYCSLTKRNCGGCDEKHGEHDASAGNEKNDRLSLTHEPAARRHRLEAGLQAPPARSPVERRVRPHSLAR